MTAIVKHTATGVNLRGHGEQNRLAIHLALLRDTNSIINYRSGSIDVWCESIEAAHATRSVAKAYGYTEISVSNSMTSSKTGTTAISLEINTADE